MYIVNAICNILKANIFNLSCTCDQDLRGNQILNEIKVCIVEIVGT